MSQNTSMASEANAGSTLGWPKTGEEVRTRLVWIHCKEELCAGQYPIGSLGCSEYRSTAVVSKYSHCCWRCVCSDLLDVKICSSVPSFPWWKCQILVIAELGTEKDIKECFSYLSQLHSAFRESRL